MCIYSTFFFVSSISFAVSLDVVFVAAVLFAFALAALLTAVAFFKFATTASSAFLDDVSFLSA